MISIEWEGRFGNHLFKMSCANALSSKFDVKISDTKPIGGVSLERKHDSIDWWHVWDSEVKEIVAENGFVAYGAEFVVPKAKGLGEQKQNSLTGRR